MMVNGKMINQMEMVAIWIIKEMYYLKENGRMEDGVLQSFRSARLPHL